ncbi:tRNA-dihydrouridine(16) synthase [Pseudomonas cichorii]|uniref:tRNA dihydrouridine synthase n=1 Tax=Pseudomonas cichorii TaxID=36746 RepID=UPI0019110675|nr:tRNA-dihydrouridine synthase [Pseudomonas cichorii]GFM75004.1 tRNA-dihydrouridine(16) synthase [Pseudomonas cichorii]
MQIALAPMEGLVDDILRNVLTRVGGVDWCVTEFIRVTERVMPAAYFYKLASELNTDAKTAAGVPLHLQLLGSDPVCLAENAAFACELGAPVLDLNFGCPAKTVNRSRGGAILLREPELLHSIVSHVRRAVPKGIPVTAKMRLGYENTDGALDCARALVDGGAERIVVHARTKVDGYKPPAHWEWIAKIQEVVKVPVVANGEIWTVDDWRRCKEICGARDIMIGRGLVARPDLARQIAAANAGEEVVEMTWAELQPMLRTFWKDCLAKMTLIQAPGRLKQWLVLLTKSYPEAVVMFDTLRRETDCERISTLIGFSPDERS